MVWYYILNIHVYIVYYDLVTLGSVVASTTTYIYCYLRILRYIPHIGSLLHGGWLLSHVSTSSYPII